MWCPCCGTWKEPPGPKRGEVWIDVLLEDYGWVKTIMKPGMLGWMVDLRDEPEYEGWTYEKWHKVSKLAYQKMVEKGLIEELKGERLKERLDMLAMGLVVSRPGEEKGPHSLR